MAHFNNYSEMLAAYAELQDEVADKAAERLELVEDVIAKGGTLCSERTKNFEETMIEQVVQLYRMLMALLSAIDRRRLLVPAGGRRQLVDLFDQAIDLQDQTLLGAIEQALRERGNVRNNMIDSDGDEESMGEDEDEDDPIYPDAPPAG